MVFYGFLRFLWGTLYDFMALLSSLPASKFLVVFGKPNLPCRKQIDRQWPLVSDRNQDIQRSKAKDLSGSCDWKKIGGFFEESWWNQQFEDELEDELGVRMSSACLTYDLSSGSPCLDFSQLWPIPGSETICTTGITWGPNKDTQEEHWCGHRSHLRPSTHWHLGAVDIPRCPLVI